MIKKKIRKAYRFWTKENCILEAKKYNNSSEWKNASGSSHTMAIKNKWIKECSEHMTPKKKPEGYWTKEQCLIEASKYKTRTDFAKDSSYAYDASRHHGWIDEICAHMGNNFRYYGYTIEEVGEKAKKYGTKKDFRISSPKMYLYASRKGWIDKVCAHMVPLGNNSVRQIYAFEHPDNTVYVGLSQNALHRRSRHLDSNNLSKTGIILKEKNKHFGDKQVFKILPGWFPQKEAGMEEIRLIEFYKNKGWVILNIAKGGSLGGGTIKRTLEKCIEVAKKYNSRVELYRNEPSIYSAINKKKWKQYCYGHMGPPKTRNVKST